MSYLPEKYNVPPETIQNMMKDGVISCKWEGYETVTKMRSEGRSIDDIIYETGYSRRTVFEILKVCKK